MVKKATEENFGVNPDGTVSPFEEWSDVDWVPEKVYDEEGVFAGVRS